MRKRRKQLREAVDAALARARADLQQQFPEFTADEIARAVPAALKRAEQEARRKAQEERLAQWTRENPDWLKHLGDYKRDPAEIERWLQEAIQRGQAALKQADERAAEQKCKQALARKIIDAGLKTVAKELHPDIGGNTEAMSRSNEIRNRLKQVYG